MSQYKGFTTVELRKPKRSKFDLSHERRTTTRMGKLTPIFIAETMPNDTFRVNSEVMMRLAPLIAPIMHRVNVFVHYFFVPNRLLWEDWELFITNGRLGTETPPVPPNIEIQDVQAEAGELLSTRGLADHLGLGDIPDAAVYGARKLDLMPFGVYQKVWYDYYRDRNYYPDNDILPFQSGDNSLSSAEIIELFSIKNRDWQKDMFTSALPFTQRGNEVLMPLQGSGSVTYLPTSNIYNAAGGAPTGLDPIVTSATANKIAVDPSVGPNFDIRVENIDDVMLTSSDVSINDLRRAVRLQEWLERNALAGSRYTESIMAHFARKTSDSRLQRAEYLGGGKVVVKISQVLTTAFSQDDTDATVPVGNMAGHGLSFGNTNRFTYNCEEHGFVIGIMSVMPTSGYMQGSKRMFFERNTFLDYPWPSFAHLGEQTVKDYELLQNPVNTPVDRTTAPDFGYQSRYVDWKSIISSSHGDFKANEGLDFWHLDRVFTDTPILGSEFVNFEDALQDRVFAVSDTDTLWCYIYNQCTVIRSLPYFGTPQL